MNSENSICVCLRLYYAVVDKFSELSLLKSRFWLHEKQASFMYLEVDDRFFKRLTALAYR